MHHLTYIVLAYLYNQVLAQYMCQNETVLHENGEYKMAFMDNVTDGNCYIRLRNVPMDTYVVVRLQMYVADYYPTPVKSYNFTNGYGESIWGDVKRDYMIIVMPPPAVDAHFSELVYAEFEFWFRNDSIPFANKTIIDVSEAPFYTNMYDLQSETTHIFKGKKSVKLFLAVPQLYRGHKEDLSRIFLYNGTSSSDLIGTLYGLADIGMIEEKVLALHVTRPTLCWGDHCGRGAMLVVYDGDAHHHYSSIGVSVMPRDTPNLVVPMDRPLKNPRPFTLKLAADDSPAGHTLFSSPPSEEYKDARKRYCPVIVESLNFTDPNATLSVYSNILKPNMEDEPKLFTFSQNSNTSAPQIFEGFARTFILDKGEVEIRLDDSNCSALPEITVSSGWSGSLSNDYSHQELIPPTFTMLKFNESIVSLNYTFTLDFNRDVQSDAVLMLFITNSEYKDYRILNPNYEWQNKHPREDPADYNRISLEATRMTVSLYGNATVLIEVGAKGCAEEINLL